ncbi:MAG: hypothetical protein ACFFDH_00950 [Promethearchaeota archaeon]
MAEIVKNIIIKDINIKDLRKSYNYVNYLSFKKRLLSAALKNKKRIKDYHPQNFD